MIEKVTLFFKDPAKISQLAIGCFFGAALLTAYLLFTLKSDLVYEGGMIDSGRTASVFVRLSIVVVLAFASCYAAVHYTRKAKKEIIVYLDKKSGKSQQEQESGSAKEQNLLDLNALKDKIAKAKTSDEKVQEGLNHLCNYFNAGQGALYTIKKKGENKTIELKSSYALVLGEGEAAPSFQLGEGLIGSAAATGKALYLDELPEGYSTRIMSGLGEALPKFLFVIPQKKENEVVGVIELATFTPLSESARIQAQEAGNILAEIS